jgi:hypothetical protein
MTKKMLPKNGEKHNLLTFTGEWKTIPRNDGGQITLAEVVCDCNRIVKFWKQATLVRNGRTKSCGCFRVTAIKLSNTKHGLRKHPLYDIWRGMKKRTLNVGNYNYHLYGERGIKVCKKWLNNFEKFYTWSIANGWKKGLSIDRINNNGDYKPSNCRWTTAKEQCRNKRNSIYHNGVHGEDRSIQLGGGRTLVASRIRSGWSKDKAFNTPHRKNYHKLTKIELLNLLNNHDTTTNNHKPNKRHRG